MFDATRQSAEPKEPHRNRNRGTAASRGPRRAVKPLLEGLEEFILLNASLAPIPAVTVPQYLGYQVPLDGAASGVNQTYTVTSSNPDIPATVAQGKFLTINVAHASSGANDPAFSGALTFQLFDDLTPLTTSRIESLVNQGFYKGKVFHRVANNFPGVNDFIVQGGSVNGNGTGSVNQPGFPFVDEFVQQLAFTGTNQLAMANAGPDTNDSQFFVTTGSPQFLNFKHTIFGQLVSGQQILTDLTKVATNQTTPVSPITITSATLSSANPDGVIHVNATNAQPGETSTVTVTAHDPTTQTTATQTFQVTVTAPTQNNRAYLAPVPAITVGAGQPAVFGLQGFGPEPTDTLTYTVQGGVTTNPATGAQSFTPIQNATASVDQTTGIVTVVPNPGFTGVIPVLVGVRDQVNRAGTGAPLDSVANFDYHIVNLTVASGARVTLPPIAVGQTVGAVVGQPTPIQLVGNSANPGTNQTLTYSLVSPPTHGTLGNFNPQTGALTYTPAPGFAGTDKFQFVVRTAGGTSSLQSNVATETVNVSAVSTGAVRIIGPALVVTPLPRTDGGTNTINVKQVNGQIQVVVNGQLDSNMPTASTLTDLIVYGSKANDQITIDPSVTLPTELNGGRGGTNILNAGGGPTIEQGWFGRNTLVGGSNTNILIGRAGHVKFVKGTGVDSLIFAGNPAPLPDNNDFLNRFFHPHIPKRRYQGHAPRGTFFKFVGNKLVPIPAPRAVNTGAAVSQNVPPPSTTATGSSRRKTTAKTPVSGTRVVSTHSRFLSRKSGKA